MKNHRSSLLLMSLLLATVCTLNLHAHTSNSHHSQADHDLAQVDHDTTQQYTLYRNTLDLIGSNTVITPPSVIPTAQLPATSFNSLTCTQMTNVERGMLAIDLVLIRDKLTQVREALLSIPLTRDIYKTKTDLTNQQLLTKTMDIIITSNCSADANLQATAMQSNLVVDRWLLGNIPLTQLIQEYTDRSLTNQYVTNCPEETPWYTPDGCIPCSQTEYFNLETGFCQECADYDWPTHTCVSDNGIMNSLSGTNQTVSSGATIGAPTNTIAKNNASTTPAGKTPAGANNTKPESNTTGNSTKPVANATSPTTNATQPTTNSSANATKPTNVTQPATNSSANTTKPANTTQPATNTTSGNATNPANPTQPATNTTSGNATQPATNTTNATSGNTTQPAANTTHPATNATNTTQPAANATQPAANATKPNATAPTNATTKPNTNETDNQTSPNATTPSNQTKPNATAPTNATKPNVTTPANVTKPNTNQTKPNATTPANQTKSNATTPANQTKPNATTPANQTKPNATTPANQTKPSANETKPNATAPSNQTKTNVTTPANKTNTTAPAANATKAPVLPPNATNPKISDRVILSSSAEPKESTSDIPCPEATPFYNGTACIQCNAPNNLFDLAKKQCSSCPDQFNFNPSSNACEKINNDFLTAKTSANLINSGMSTNYWNYLYDNVKSKNGSVKDCPIATPYYSSLNKCIACPAPNKYFNLDTRKCQGCATPFVYNETQRDCIDMSQSDNPVSGNALKMSGTIFTHQAELLQLLHGSSLHFPPHHQ